MKSRSKRLSKTLLIFFTSNFDCVCVCHAKLLNFGGGSIDRLRVLVVTATDATAARAINATFPQFPLWGPIWNATHERERERERAKK